MISFTTCYEIIARIDSGATLRDVALFAFLFWYVAFFTLLQVFEGVDMWKLNIDFGWLYQPAFVDAAVVLKRVVEGFPLDELLLFVEDLGAFGLDYFWGLLLKWFGMVGIGFEVVFDVA